jgi:hypothetical protein
MQTGSNNHPVHDHEHSDAPVGLLAKFLAGLVIVSILVVGVLAGLWRVYAEFYKESSTSPWAGPRELPPGPRLQTAPVIDLQEYLQREQQRLNSYGWVDQSTGKVHIPIEKAMEMIVQRGVPSTTQPAAKRETARAK